MTNKYNRFRGITFKIKLMQLMNSPGKVLDIYLDLIHKPATVKVALLQVACSSCNYSSLWKKATKENDKNSNAYAFASPNALMRDEKFSLM